MKTFLKLIGVTLIILAVMFITLIPVELFCMFIESRFSDTVVIIIYGAIIMLLIGLLAYEIVYKNKD